MNNIVSIIKSNPINQTEIENNVLEQPQNIVLNEISEESEINDILKNVGLEEDEQTKEVLKIFMAARGGSCEDIHKRISEISKSIKKLFLDMKNECKAQKEVAKEVEKLITIFVLILKSFKDKIKEILQSLKKSEREIDAIIEILSDDKIDEFDNVDKEALRIQLDILKHITDDLNKEIVKEREQNEIIMKKTVDIKDKLEQQKTKHQGYFFKKHQEKMIRNLNIILTELNQLYTLSSQLFNSYNTVDSTSKNLLQEIDILKAKNILENSRLIKKNAKIAINIKKLIETNINTLNEILNINVDNWTENTTLNDKLDTQEPRLAIDMPDSK